MPSGQGLELSGLFLAAEEQHGVSAVGQGQGEVADVLPRPNLAAMLGKGGEANFSGEWGVGSGEWGVGSGWCSVRVAT